MGKEYWVRLGGGNLGWVFEPGVKRLERQVVMVPWSVVEVVGVGVRLMGMDLGK